MTRQIGPYDLPVDEPVTGGGGSQYDLITANVFRDGGSAVEPIRILRAEILHKTTAVGAVRRQHDDVESTTRLIAGQIGDRNNGLRGADGKARPGNHIRGRIEGQGRTVVVEIGKIEVHDGIAGIGIGYDGDVLRAVLKGGGLGVVVAGVATTAAGTRLVVLVDAGWGPVAGCTVHIRFVLRAHLRVCVGCFGVEQEVIDGQGFALPGGEYAEVPGAGKGLKVTRTGGAFVAALVNDPGGHGNADLHTGSGVGTRVSGGEYDGIDRELSRIGVRLVDGKF